MLITLSLIVGFVLLYYGAEMLVKGGVHIAARFKISPLVVGLTLVAFGTSAPELVVSATAAVEGNGGIAIGNVVGSNICNIALILGTAALIRPLTVNPALLKLDVPLMIVSTIVFSVIYFLTGGINRLAALLFLISLIAYTCWTIYSAKKSGQQETLTPTAPPPTPHRGLLVDLFLVGSGLLLLIAGSKSLVWGTVETARIFGISEAVISLTVVALGTSLPELATSVIASLKRETDIAIGNIIGSNIFNILAILGIAPLLRPIASADAGVSTWDFGLMIVLAVILYPMMATKKSISRIEGGVLLASYCAYIAYCISKL